MERKKFSVQGRSEEPYEVILERDGVSIRCFCTCAASEWGQMCKHVMEILKGKQKACEGCDEMDLADVLEWMPGSNVEGFLAELDGLAAEADRIKRRVKASKKAMYEDMRLL